jgi:chromosome segregation ATPase
MTTKDEYIAKFKAQLAEWETELEGLKSQAGSVADEAKATCGEHIEELRCKWEEGKAKLDEMTDAADDTWDEFKDEADEKWTMFTDSVKESIDRVKSYFA